MEKGVKTVSYNLNKSVESQYGKVSHQIHSIKNRNAKEIGQVRNSLMNLKKELGLLSLDEMRKIQSVDERRPKSMANAAKLMDIKEPSATHNLKLVLRQKRKLLGNRASNNFKNQTQNVDLHNFSREIK